MVLPILVVWISRTSSVLRCNRSSLVVDDSSDTTVFLRHCTSQSLSYRILVGIRSTYHLTLRFLHGLQLSLAPAPNILRGYTTHQHPFRLLRFGSGAPGLLGRGIAT